MFDAALLNIKMVLIEMKDETSRTELDNNYDTTTIQLRIFETVNDVC